MSDIIATIDKPTSIYNYDFSSGITLSIPFFPSQYYYTRAELVAVSNYVDDSAEYNEAIEIFGHIIQLQFERIKLFGIAESKKYFSTFRDVIKSEMIKGPEIRKNFAMTIENFLKETFLITSIDKPYYIATLSKHESIGLVAKNLLALIDYFSSEFETRLTDDELEKRVRLLEEHVGDKPKSKKNIEPLVDFELTSTHNGEDDDESIEVENMKIETVVNKKQPEQKSRALFELNLPLGDLVNNALNEYIENSDVLKNLADYIKREAKKLQPNVIQIGENIVSTIEGRLHKQFKKVCTVANIERCAFISGPAGTGKTTLAAQVAAALNLNYAHISCTAGMSEAHLLGRMTAHGEYLPSPFVETYENGGVFLFDEVDAADANTLLIVNSALANGYLSIPNRVAQPKAKRHEDFICICAANTYGTGSIEYAGRAPLDAAFLDRFVGSKVAVTYDEDLEKTIAGDELKTEANKLFKIRKNIVEKKIRKVVSTRAFVSLRRQCSKEQVERVTFNEFLDSFFLGWSAEEKAKAMEGV